MNTTSLTLSTVATKALPALSGSSIRYNAERNVFLTCGFTSTAGNNYYQAIRISNRLAIFYDIGEGYSATFLNGIKLFCWNGEKAQLIAQRNWGGFDNYRFFSEQFAKEQSIQMLRDYIASQAKLQGALINEQQLLTFARDMVEETRQKRLT